MKSDPGTFKLPRRLPAVKVVEKKLGRQRARGQAWSADALIEIDPRQSPKSHLGTVCHEWLHLMFDDMSERDVARLERSLATLLWHQGYRRIYK